jgi:hypothetical protein
VLLLSLPSLLLPVVVSGAPVLGSSVVDPVLAVLAVLDVLGPDDDIVIDPVDPVSSSVAAPGPSSPHAITVSVDREIQRNQSMGPRHNLRVRLSTIRDRPAS